MSNTLEYNVDVNDISIHIVEMGKGKPVLFLHGFPELWYSWRHQMAYLAQNGYRAIAIDLRGYGQSSVPDDIESYSMRNMVTDIVQIIDKLELKTVALIGHDWGANIAWACAQIHPKKFDVLVSLSVPFSPRPPLPLTKLIEKNSSSFNWLLYFQKQGVAEREMEEDYKKTLRRIFFGLSGDAPEGTQKEIVAGLPKNAKLLDNIPEPTKLPNWLTEEDLDYFTNNFKKTGFTGALNRYRNVDYDWSDLEKESQNTIAQPTLFIGGELDTATQFNIHAIDSMEKYVPNLKNKIIIPHIGHYVQQEAPQWVNKSIINFLNNYY